MKAPQNKNYMLYDGECPFCSSFSEFYRMKRALPRLALVSMRDAEGLRKLKLPAHLDFNLGMILLLADGRILQGEEAFRFINRKVKKTSLRDCMILGISGIRPIAKIVYPVLFTLRKAVLKFKGISSEMSRIDLKK